MCIANFYKKLTDLVGVLVGLSVGCKAMVGSECLKESTVSFCGAL